MHECTKEKCRHWQRANHKACSLITALEKECLETGEFQHPTPKKHESAWEDVKLFSLFDLARIGVEDELSGLFWEHQEDSDPEIKYSASVYRSLLIDLGIFAYLVSNGFVRKQISVVKPGDCFATTSGNLMVVSGGNGFTPLPDGALRVVGESGCLSYVCASKLTEDGFRMNPTPGEQ